MKKMLWISLLMLLALVLLLTACRGEDKCEHSFGEWTVTDDATCTLDGEKVRVCAECGEEEKSAILKTGVHIDSDTDHLCDYGCGEELGECVDNDNDHHCDYGCDKWFGECADSLGDGNHLCDCGCGDVLSQCSDRDDDGDHRCDECGRDGISTHIDNDLDGHCYECEKLVPLDVEWDNTELIFQLSLNTNYGELSSGSKRFLAGDVDGDAVTALDNSIKTRNNNANEFANVNITYTYLSDNNLYAWGECVDYIWQSRVSKDRPDFYVNFVHDLVSTSFKGILIDLYSGLDSQNGGAMKPDNYFSFAKAGYEEGDDGYMYEYMRSLSPSDSKMYILASDYLIDTTRAFMVVPVDVQLLNFIDSDIDELYQTVYDGNWTYDAVIEYSKVIYEKDTQHGRPGASIYDRVGFIAGAYRSDAYGLLYSSGISILERMWDEQNNCYYYGYSSPMYQTELYDFCDALTRLFKSEGVYALIYDEARVTNDYSSNTGDGATLQDVREKFGKHEALFGGVVTLASLEHTTYRGMMEGDGFGVLPVPLYKGAYESDGEIVQPDYLTAIYDVGRVGAISSYTLKFPQLSAYLHYQSVNSDIVLENYYTEYFGSENDALTSANVEMLKFIRSNVGSQRDSTWDDMACSKFTQYGNIQNADCKWHVMLYHAIPAYQKTDMDMSYEHYYVTKQTYLLGLYKDYYKVLE